MNIGPIMCMGPNVGQLNREEQLWLKLATCADHFILFPPQLGMIRQGKVFPIACA